MKEEQVVRNLRTVGNQVNAKVEEAKRTASPNVAELEALKGAVGDAEQRIQAVVELARASVGAAEEAAAGRIKRKQEGLAKLREHVRSVMEKASAAAFADALPTKGEGLDLAKLVEAIEVDEVSAADVSAAASDKATFVKLVRTTYKCLLAAPMTAELAAGSEAVRELQANELVEAVEVDKDEETERVKVIADKDGATGWATAKNLAKEGA